jgi:hypothetical protein
VLADLVSIKSNDEAQKADSDLSKIRSVSSVQVNESIHGSLGSHIESLTINQNSLSILHTSHVGIIS